MTPDDPARGPSPKTVLRPQPGGASRSQGPRGPGPSGAALPAGAVPAGGAVPPSGAAAASGAVLGFPAAGAAGAGAFAGAAASVQAGLPASLAEFTARGGNALLAAAGPLLSLGATLGATVYQADVDGLRRQAVEAIKAFEAEARASGASEDDVTIARYVVCTFLDSAIYQTPWGGQAAWGARSLLNLFHNEAQGGEKFFRILERLRRDPARYIDLLELQYACLALGFEGKYRLEPNGRVALQGLQDELYRLIRAQRPAVGAGLSPHWEGLAAPVSRGVRWVPAWVVATAGACVVLALFIALRARLAEDAAPVVAALAVRGIATDYTAPAAPQPAGRLEQLLEPEVRAHELTVERFGKRIVITITLPELFRSGSAHVAPAYAPLFAAIGRALAQVPGRIIVVGHTDDQPVHSLRFPDNFALSRARAIDVARLLKPQLSDFSRVEWTGLGSTQPRYLPPSTPANRRRNRRVEIDLIER